MKKWNPIQVGVRKEPAPCFKDGKPCNKRKLGCHGTCEEYKGWKEKTVEKQKKEMDANRERREADRRKKIAVENYNRRRRNHKA